MVDVWGHLSHTEGLLPAHSGCLSPSEPHWGSASCSRWMSEVIWATLRDCFLFLVNVWVHLSHMDGLFPAHGRCLRSGPVHSSLCFLFLNSPLKTTLSEFHRCHSLVLLLLNFPLISVLPTSTGSPQIPPDLIIFWTWTQSITFSCLNALIPRHYTSGSSFSLPFAGCFQFHWLLKIGMPKDTRLQTRSLSAAITQAVKILSLSRRW